jgi:drug/metabolite transporter (DMT)-like permease
VSGEALALLSALFYGLGGATIAQGARTARGDNGVYLSIIVTALVSLGLWLGFGTVSLDRIDAAGLGWFVLAGVAAMGIGRWGMYRGTALLGALRISLYKRLIPLFSLGVGIVLLAQWPGGAVLLGGALILGGVLWGVTPGGPAGRGSAAGHAMALAASAAYAMAYGLRALGLDSVPDPALGTLIGAVTGLIWFAAGALFRADRPAALARLVVDRGPWHWVTAVSLSLGQCLQFFALQRAELATVAVLGATDTIFTMLVTGYLLRTEAPAGLRLWLAALACMAGTLLVMR